jgi:hypothetical protein
MEREKFLWGVFLGVVILSIIGGMMSVSAWKDIKRSAYESDVLSYRAQVDLMEARKEIAARKEIRLERERELAALAEKEKIPRFVAPPKPDMEKMKRLGCVADGLLSDYGDESQQMTKYIDASKCYYLHRALETWLEAPDFEKALKIKNDIHRKDIVYGMFLAEAINKNTEYFFSEENRYFDFGNMCRKGSDNDWGEHTCKPSFESEEYRKYLREITRKAMDMGIQSFMFGQIQYQESKDLDPAWARIIVTDMRAYAEWLGMDIVIGAQTNDIDDGSYLGLFDYIEGGVGIDSRGDFPENDACHPRWWQKRGDWCWALLWHDRFAKKAQNVFVHLDWSGVIGDDMSRFTRMNESERATTLRRLYTFFTSEGHGFLLPVLARLHIDNNGCTGVTKHFYSPQERYDCDDEDAIDDILSTWSRK